MQILIIRFEEDIMSGHKVFLQIFLKDKKFEVAKHMLVNFIVLYINRIKLMSFSILF
jgi:hypothetical protein